MFKQILKKLRQNNKKKRGRAYEADSGSESDTEDKEVDEEIAALTQEAARKLPYTTWIADTGASSHMTDQKDLFRGPLSRMRRRVIKVGGGYLNTDQYGDIEILSKTDTPITIRRVYYVPSLGANLLSCRRLCTLGLIGAFNTSFTTS